MKIAIAQTNTTVGDLCGNAQRILSFARRAAESHADVVVFPELTLTGYPPRDLLEKQSFLDGAERELARIAAESAGLPLTIICGTVTRTGSSAGNPIHNSAAVLKGGRVIFRQNKMLLPSYDVFDEKRYFEPAAKQSPLDAWTIERRPHGLRRRVERQAILGTPALQPRPGGRADCLRRAPSHQH